MKSILFVCTGNVFRSMTAEYCLDNISGKYNAGSAGTNPHIQQPHHKTVEELSKRGIDVSKHKQRKLNEKMLSTADLIVAMSTDHKKFIKKNFGKDASLFHKICFGKEDALLDIGEFISDWKNNPELVDKYIIYMVNHIYNAMPKFIENVDKFFS